MTPRLPASGLLCFSKHLLLHRPTLFLRRLYPVSIPLHYQHCQNADHPGHRPAGADPRSFDNSMVHAGYLHTSHFMLNMRGRMAGPAVCKCGRRRRGKRQRRYRLLAPEIVGRPGPQEAPARWLGRVFTRPRVSGTVHEGLYCSVRRGSRVGRPVYAQTWRDSCWLLPGVSLSQPCLHNTL